MHTRNLSVSYTHLDVYKRQALAEEKGLNLLTVCNTCTLMLREAKNELDKNEKEKNEVNKKLAQIGKQYRGTTDITHFLWVLILSLIHIWSETHSWIASKTLSSTGP